MEVKRITYDKAYPIRIVDSWGDVMYLTEEQAQEIIKKLQEILKTPLDKPLKVWYNSYTKEREEHKK